MERKTVYGLPLAFFRSLKQDLVQYLGAVAGGRFGFNILAPNSLAEYSNLLIRLSIIESTPYFQAGILRQVIDSRGDYSRLEL